MSRFASPRFLRNVLLLDAASCLACGALQVAATGALVPWLGLPAPLLLETGLFLLVYAALVGWIATRRLVPTVWVRLLVVGNLGWALACVGLVFSGLIRPTVLGVGYLVLQAVVVAVLAELQWMGLRGDKAGRLQSA